MSELSPKIIKRRYFSPVWLLPIIAAILGGWLMLQSINNKGISISIHFEQATGIKPGKTKIRYKGLEVGHVVKLTLDDRLEGVDVEANIKPKAASILREQTRFWLVSPKASLTGISGLDTLVSGNYIDVQPGEGATSTQFIALDSAPATLSENNLTVRLISEQLGSLTVGAPVYFKQVTVGEVHNFKLSKDNKVLIDLVINKKFSGFVKKDSRFWNISGMQAELTADGFKMHLNGIASLISGGIAFDSPAQSQAAENKRLFTLFPSLHDSQRGIEVSLSLPNNHGLKLHNKLMLNDLEMGEITQISLNDQAQATATLLVEPMIERYLNKGSSIYLIKPKLALEGSKNLSRLLTGNYLGLTLGSGKPSRHFQVQAQAPLPYRGQHLVLNAKHLKNIKTGSPVLYLGYKIGEVISTQIDKKQTGILVDLLIKDQYQSLLTSNCRFYIGSPVTLNADFKGVSFESGGLDSFLHGQIILSKAHHQSADLQRLYSSKKVALLSGENSQTNKIITLKPVGKIKPLNDGAPLFYQGIQIGQLTNQKLSNSQLEYQLQIQGQYRHLVSKKSHFWYQSPFKIDASLSGIQFESAPLASIMNGGIEMTLSEQASTQDPSHFPLFANYQEATVQKVPITLHHDNVRQLSVGTPIKYRGLVIGKIEQFWLSFDGDKVQIKAYLYKKYASLLTHKESQFWIVEPKISLTQVENLDTVLTGAFIQAEPGDKTLIKQKIHTYHFSMTKQAPVITHSGLHIELSASQLGSVQVGTPLYFRQVKVGVITQTRLGDNSKKVLLDADIFPQYAHLVRANSKFWNVSGFSLDIGLTGGEIEAESLETILSGGVAFSSPDGQAKPAITGQQFELYSQAESEWQEWDPMIKK